MIAAFVMAAIVASSATTPARPRIARRAASRRVVPAAHALDLLARAYAAYDAGRFAAAAADLRAHLALRPRDAHAWLQLAYTQQELQHHRSAVDALNRYLVLAPLDSSAVLVRAYELSALGEHVQAVTAFAAYLERRPGDAHVRLQHGYELLELGRPGDAASDFRSYLAVDGGNRRVWQQLVYACIDAHDHTGALNALDRYLALAPDDATMRLQRGYELLELDRPADAAADLRAYLQAHPDQATVWLQSAYANIDAKRFDAALDAFTRYLALVPGDDLMRLERAYALDALGRDEAASSEFKSLAASSDATVSAQATRELRARITGRTGNREVDTFVQHESRFADTIGDADFYVLAAPRRVQPYGVLHLTADTRSTIAGLEPQVYNDNALVLDGGLRYNLGALGESRFFIEAGGAHSLIRRGNSADLRYGFATSLERGSIRRARTLYDLNIAAYSRFAGNVIGYGSVTHDFPFAGTLRAVAGANVVADAHRNYFNNLLELKAGLQFNAAPFTLRLMGVRGLYIARGIDRLEPRAYTTFRPEIVWSTSW